MLADPQSLTINAVAQSLPAIARGINTSSYQKDDTTVKLTVAHAYAKRTRRSVRVDFSKIAADPLNSSVNVKYAMSAYLVVDLPPVGFTNTEAKYVVDALTAWLTATSGSNTVKVLGGES